MSISERRLTCGYSILAACVMFAGLAEGEDEPKKSGFFNRITDLVKKKEEPPPPAPEAKPKPAAKAKTASTTKSKGTADSASPNLTITSTKKKSASKAPGKKSSEDARAEVAKKEASKSEAKPSTVVGKTPAPEKEKTGSTKSAAEKTGATDDKKAPALSAVAKTSTTEPSAASVSVDPPGRPMGGFAPGDARAVDVTATSRVGSVTTSPSNKLTETPESSASINPLPPGKNGGWDLVKYNGHDYITAASIQRFYGFATLKVDGSHVWLKTTNLILKGQIGSMEMLINNVKFILSYPVAESDGKVIFSRLDVCKLIDPVLRPDYITDADPFDTVVLDAGHGGHDSGAKGVYGYEKDFALKMAFAAKASLEKRGFKVVMTRSTDEFITRTGRVAIANKTPNSVFISLHFNSAGPTATGIETFALTPQGGSASLERGGGLNANGLTGNRQDSENIALATAVHAKVVSTYKLIDRGIKRAQWTVLTGCNRPGILFEGGFVTNVGECKFIASDNYRRSLAETIGDAVVNYRKALQPPNMVRRSSSPYGR